MKKALIARSLVLGLLCSLVGPTVTAASRPLPNKPTVPPLSAVIPSTPISTQATPSTAPSKEEIDKQIDAIKKTIKGLKTINAVATTLLVGGTLSAVAITLAIIVGGVALAVILPAAAAAQGAATVATLSASLASFSAILDTVGALAAPSMGATFLATTAATQIMTLTAGASVSGSIAAATAAATATTAAATTAGIAGISTVIISGAIATLVAGSLGTAGLVLFGGLSKETVVMALEAKEKFNELEAQYPGLLTEDQKKAIQDFNKTIQGPIALGIAKGLQIKKLKNNIVADALTKHPELIKTFGGAIKAQKAIEEYLKDQKELFNLALAHALYKKQREILKQEAGKHKPLAPKRTQLDLKILGLDIKFAFLPLQLKAAEKEAAKFDKKYAGAKDALAEAVQKFIIGHDKIIADLMVKK